MSNTQDLSLLGSTLTSDGNGADVTGTVTASSTLTAQKLVSTDGILELDDDGTHNGIINSPASLIINIDSNANSTGEDFIIAKDRTSTTGGTELFRVQEDGNVGIGTSSPTIARLQVKGTGTTVSTNSIFAENSGSAGLFAIRDNGDAFILGDVGIGQSSPVSFGANTAGLTLNGSSGSHVTWQNNGTNVAFAYNVGNNFKIGSEQVGSTLSFNSSGLTRMTIDAGGSVLIGKTTPADLHDTWNHIIIGEKGAIISENGAGGIDGITLADNAYIDSDTGSYAYQTAAAASLITQSGGVTTFSNAASGSAGAALTPVQTMAINADRKVDVGGVANQTVAVLNARFNGAAIEFGHGNNGSGYYGTAGSYGNNGQPYISFSCYSQENLNLFTTNGFKGNLITGDLSGNLTFAQITNANAVDQSPTNRMTLDSSGNLGIGVTPESWTAFNPVLRIKNASTGGGGALAGSGVDNFRMFANTYYDSGVYKRISAGFATNYEQASGAHIWYSNASSSADSTFTPTARMTLDAGGNLAIADGVLAANSTVASNANNHIFTVTKTATASSLLVSAVSLQGYSTAATAMQVGNAGGTGRSINAGGTVNASGADYAEYERNGGLSIAKGDIVGFKADGVLTLTFSEAIRFAVKSTDPSYVGGDTWGGEDQVGVQPQAPAEDAEQEVIDQYETDIAAFNAAHEAARQLVDRIAYSGKVPVNIQGATAGDYIIAVAADDGSINGQAVSDPDFTQYKLAVGRVNRILDDGRAEIAVIIH